MLLKPFLLIADVWIVVILCFILVFDFWLNLPSTHAPFTFSCIVYLPEQLLVILLSETYWFRKIHSIKNGQYCYGTARHPAVNLQHQNNPILRKAQSVSNCRRSDFQRRTDFLKAVANQSKKYPSCECSVNRLINQIMFEWVRRNDVPVGFSL